MRCCDGCLAPAEEQVASNCAFCGRRLPLALPTVFEVLQEAHGYTYARRDGTIFAVATRFGGRWRVSDAKGDLRFWLAPLGVAGTDDVEVVGAGAYPVGSIIRDRRRPGHWNLFDATARAAGVVSLDPSGELVVVTHDGGADVAALLGPAEGGASTLCRGRILRLAPTLVLALPLVFLTNAVLVPTGLSVDHSAEAL